MILDTVIRISPTLENRVGARSWCYILENEGVITKGDFDDAEKFITECRKNGKLPVDFTAEYNERIFEGVEEPEQVTVEDYFVEMVRNVWNNAHNWYSPDWWEGEKYYLQLLVEKLDLKNLFMPICKEYHIPVANGKGWSDINQRYDLIKRCMWAESRGLTPIILYAGDFDPYGKHISDTLIENIHQLDGLLDINGNRINISMHRNQIKRFCLNKDFIDRHNLTWIDNLLSGSGKDMSKPNKNGKIKRFIQEWIDTVGKRKCEAEAAMKVPKEARQLFEQNIQGYLGRNAKERFESKRAEIEKRLLAFKERKGIANFPDTLA